MSKPRILVVDDEPNLSHLVSMFLERTERFQVLVENRSSQALARAREFKPDVVLLDVDMPGKDGGEVARDMAADAQLRSIPVLFFTSLISREEAGTKAVMRGSYRYLAKPVNPNVLVETLDLILAQAVAA
ncbi:MAG TPA: response regulator [Chthoniobacteraceae bacterium]|nr:response regulator [Chthoniobacteraceae bacterium]